MPKLIREKQWLLDSAIIFNNYPIRKTKNIEKVNKINKRNQRRTNRQNKKKEEIIYLYTTTETYEYEKLKENLETTMKIGEKMVNIEIMGEEQDRLHENSEKIADIKENLETTLEIGEKIVHLEIDERRENELRVIRRIGKILKGNEIPAVFRAEKWNKII